MAARYVYGVVNAGAAAPPGPGIDDGKVRLVASDGLAALVSDVDGDLRLGRKAMTAHANVLEQALANGSVLPMRFGIVMEDEEMIREQLLDRHRPELAAQLEDFAGKVELKLRATYDESRLMREVMAQDQDVARLRASLRGVPDDASYYGRIRLGELVAEAVERKRQIDSGRMLDALSPLALAVEVGEPNHERVVLSVSFLIERQRIEEFDAAVDKLGREQESRMRFKYTGPLPPHSFVRLQAGA
jgi:Gas vesicle synthesis protein GvpL/GvpF